MTKPPDSMTSVWVRDEDGDLRQRVKHGARRKGQTVADFLRRAIDDALEATEVSSVAKSDRKIGQDDRQDCCKGHTN